MTARGTRLVRRWAAAGVLGALIGCGGEAPPSAESGEEPAVVRADTAPTEKPASGPSPETQDPNPETGQIDPKYRQPFEAAALIDGVPDGMQLPPPRTIGGVSTPKVRIAVEAAWDQIALVDPDSGDPLPLKAVVNTAQGEIEISLDPELAPNHVRNFIALAETGYYSGLCFERTVHQDGEGDDRLDMVTFGCPLGTGTVGVSHVGYFMAPEFSETVKHEAGTVGFWREQGADTAGCRLYITLGPAAILDGNFTVIGKVTGGLDVVRKIARRPVRGSDPESPESELPVEPVAVGGVSVRGLPADAAVGVDGEAK